MQRLLLLCLVLVCHSCTTRYQYIGDWVEKIDSPEMTYLMMNYAEAMKREYGMDLQDSKVFYEDEIQNISITFRTQTIADMCEARKILVDMVESFLTRLNDHALLRFQLEQPFTAENLIFTVQFDSFFTEFVDPLKVAVVCLRGGVVAYFAGNIKNWHADWSDQRIEPYAKSLEIVRAQRAAELQYIDEMPQDQRMQPHPFLFDKMIPIDERDRTYNNRFPYDVNYVEIPLGASRFGS